MRNPRSPWHRIRLVTVLAVWMSLAARVPVAMSQPAPADIWSIQLHGGVFAPFEANGAGTTTGVRYGRHFNPHLYGGLLSGWTFKRTSIEQALPDPPGSGPRVELAQVDAHLVPLMGYIQVNLTERFFLVPLVGIGAGYEWLSLDVLDHGTGVKTHTLYANVAWEAYGGVALRLNRKVRLNGELFYNGGSLERRALDENGRSMLLAVHVNGVGARVGLDMDFD